MTLWDALNADRARRKPGILTSMMIAQLRDKLDGEEIRSPHLTFVALPDPQFDEQPVIIALVNTGDGSWFEHWNPDEDLWEIMPIRVTKRLPLDEVR